MVLLTAQGPEIFHTNWRRVTAEQPARPDEMLVARATGLGATSPPTAPDRPFPAAPRARVKAAIDIRINGRSADIGEVFGWPGESDTYRVDFRVPRDVSAGTVKWK